jgi:hypothetical protein
MLVLAARSSKSHREVQELSSWDQDLQYEWKQSLFLEAKLDGGQGSQEFEGLG